MRDANTGQIVAGQEIHAYDASRTFFITAVTDANGVYSLILPAGLPTGTGLRVYTNACNQSYAQSVTFAGLDAQVDFNVCPSGHRYHLQGRFRSGGLSGNFDSATVYLISEAAIPLTMDTVLSVVDSFLAIDGPSMVDFYREYNAIPAGRLYLKIALNSGHSEYANFLPTYAASSTKWRGAVPLTNRSFMSDTTTIAMQAGVNPGGPGFIGGSVKLGANKSSAVGDPLSGRILLLTRPDGTPVAYTYSDAAGRYALRNLALGTYLLAGDALGKDNPELEVTLSTARDSIGDVTFEENDHVFKGAVPPLSIKTRPGGAICAYPLPATGELQIRGLQSVPGGKTLELRDVRGVRVGTQSIGPGQDGTLDMRALPAGQYLLQVKMEGAVENLRVTKR